MVCASSSASVSVPGDPAAVLFPEIWSLGCDLGILWKLMALVCRSLSLLQLAAWTGFARLMAGTPPCTPFLCLGGAKGVGDFGA